MLDQEDHRIEEEKVDFKKVKGDIYPK